MLQNQNFFFELFFKFAPCLLFEILFRIFVQQIQLILIRPPHVVDHPPGKRHADTQAVDPVNLRLKTGAFLFGLFFQPFLLGLPALSFSSRLAGLDVLRLGSTCCSCTSSWAGSGWAGLVNSGFLPTSTTPSSLPWLEKWRTPFSSVQ